MTPKRSCEDQVTMVPDLVPNDRCVDVPREVCTMQKVNPRKVRKPVVKTWCGEIGTTTTTTTTTTSSSTTTTATTAPTTRVLQ